MPRVRRTYTVDALGEHLDWLRARNLSPRTIHHRRNILLRLARELAKPLLDATAPEVAAWWHGLTERYEPAGRATLLSHVQSYYKWLVREGYRIDDPTVRLDRPRLPRMLPRPIAAGDLEVALATADGRELTILTLCAYSGMRACEVAGLRRDHIRDDLNPAFLLVTEAKGGNERTIPLHPRIAALALPRQGYIVPRLDGGPGGCTANQISKLGNRALHSVGISDTLHSLRHHFLTEIYRATKDLRLTQALAGHRSPDTTAGYTKWADENAAAAVLSIR